MEKLKISLSLLFAVIFSCMASAQNKIKGRIVNEQGQGIEYANIIVGNAYTMSNVEGYYEFMGHRTKRIVGCGGECGEFVWVSES